MIWTGDNLAEAFALWARAPRTHAIGWRRRADGGRELLIRDRVGGWPRDPVRPADHRPVPVGARLQVVDGAIEVRP